MEIDNQCQECFSYYRRALDKLSEAVDYIETSLAEKAASSLPEYSVVIEDIIKDGLIQRFEYTHELACHVMKEYASKQGDVSRLSCEDITREGIRLQLITDAPLWMDMLTSRDKIFQTFHEEVATDIYNRVLGEYYFAFLDFRDLMKTKLKGAEKE